jgi:methyl-accepting chemotaxis protein
MIDPVRIGRTGYAFLLDKSGMVFSIRTRSGILKQNVFEQDWGKRIRDQDKGGRRLRFGQGRRNRHLHQNKATGWTWRWSCPARTSPPP